MVTKIISAPVNYCKRLEKCNDENMIQLKKYFFIVCIVGWYVMRVKNLFRLVGFFGKFLLM